MQVAAHKVIAVKIRDIVYLHKKPYYTIRQDNLKKSEKTKAKDCRGPQEKRTGATDENGQDKRHGQETDVNGQRPHGQFLS
jgi:hypothetical protein